MGRRKTAIISGITGQDGAYLSELLIQKNYEVIGLSRDIKPSNQKNLVHLDLVDKLTLKECNLLKKEEIKLLIEEYRPHEFYNLAAQSSVSESFKRPSDTLSFNIYSVLNILEVIRTICPGTRFYQASSSEMFGEVSQLPIDEKTVLNPLSPYAVSKASAHFMVRSYRKSYNLFACSGILFNHESFLREENFFIKKVIKGAIEIWKGEKKELVLGNLEIKRDFGYAPEYVKAMHKMLQQKTPDDFVICSGISLTLKQIVEYVFERVGVSFDKVKIDKANFRPSEITNIYGNNSKASKFLDWHYQISFFKVIDILIKLEMDESTLR